MQKEQRRIEGVLYYRTLLPQGKLLLHILSREGFKEKAIATRSRMRSRDLPWFSPLELVLSLHKARIPFLEEVTTLSPHPLPSFRDPLLHGFMLFLGELIHVGIPEEIPHPRLYEVISLLGETPLTPKLWGEIPLAILGELGIYRLPEVCPYCGAPPVPQAWVEEPACPACSCTDPTPFFAEPGPYRIPLSSWIHHLERLVSSDLKTPLKTPAYLYELLKMFEVLK